MFKILHTFTPNSILLHLGPLKIHWYGIFIASGIITGYFAVKYLFKKYNIDIKYLYDLPFYVLVPALLCGRIYYVFYAWEFYRNDLSEVFKIWHGGLAIHGDIIGGIIGVLIFVKIKKINFWKLADIIAPGLAIGTAVGRWGNYFNQELYGKPTELPWGIPIELINRPEMYKAFSYFHPAFLYESILDIVLFLILLLLHKNRFQNKEKKIINGSILFSYLTGYSIIRFLMEFVRIDYSPLFLGIRWAQFVSGILFLISIAGLIMISKKNKKAFIKKQS